MSKYINLTLHLGSLDGESWNATFNDVEQVLGFPLPPSARQYAAWWANQDRAQGLAWQSAGWNAFDVDLANEKVTFRYVGAQETGDAPAVRPLTIAQAKAGLAANFNVPVDAIEILIRG